jgi:hypothetical protein
VAVLDWVVEEFTTDIVLVSGVMVLAFAPMSAVATQKTARAISPKNFSFMMVAPSINSEILCLCPAESIVVIQRHAGDEAE